MTKKMMFGAVMALLSMTSCFNGNSNENVSSSPSFDEVLTSRRSVALGYRAEEPNRPERKSLDEIVKFF